MQHHAQLFVGSKEWALSLLPEALRQQSQDVRHIELERLSIDDVRNLIKEANLKSVGEEGRSFLIITENILREAQNALLKLLEDPNPGTTFYLIVPDDNFLLPTVRSRLHAFAREEKQFSSNAFTEFRKASYKERLALIETKLKEGDQAWIGEILASLEVYAEKERNPQLLRDTLTLLQYIPQKGGSKKMLLEHLALSL